MKKNIKIILLFVFVALTYATEFEYSAAINNWIDNREMQTAYLKSQTFLNSGIFLEAGFKLKETNRLRWGVNYYKDFGEPKEWDNLSPIIYYQFKRTGDDLCFGIFNRSVLRKYPTALINDSINVYRPFIEGLVYEKSGKIFKQNLWLDWVSAITSKAPDGREAFLTGLSGEFSFNAFYFNYYFLYHHLAHSVNHPRNEHVEHRGGINVTIGKSLNDIGFIDSLNISVDGLLTYNKEMFVDDSWQTPFGITLKSYLLLSPKWAISGQYYRGLKKDKGRWHNIPTGDQIYRASDFGLLEILFLPFNNDFVSSELKFGVWFVDGVIDSRQVFRVNLKFDGVRKIKER